MCCQKLQTELKTGRFTRNNGLYILFQTSDYDEDYGHAVFEHRMKIEFCPFCGTKH